MNDHDSTPEDMRQEHGDNVLLSEKTLGEEAAKLGKRYDSLIHKHGKLTHEIHDVIIEFGRKLQEGLDMYGPGYEFGQWIKRRKLDKYRLCHSQQERTACMLIARLHDHGIQPDEHDEHTVPCKLDLTECKRVVPTDIMKWAREKQRHLFPHLKPRGAKSLKKNGSVKADEIPDLGCDDGRLEGYINAALSSFDEAIENLSDGEVTALIRMTEKLLRLLKERQG